jgi:hypothetical protein
VSAFQKPQSKRQNSSRKFSDLPASVDFSTETDENLPLELVALIEAIADDMADADHRADTEGDSA